MNNRKANASTRSFKSPCHINTKDNSITYSYKLKKAYTNELLPQSIQIEKDTYHLIISHSKEDGTKGSFKIPKDRIDEFISKVEAAKETGLAELDKMNWNNSPRWLFYQLNEDNIAVDCYDPKLGISKAGNYFRVELPAEHLDKILDSLLNFEKQLIPQLEAPISTFLETMNKPRK